MKYLNAWSVLYEVLWVHGNSCGAERPPLVWAAMLASYTLFKLVVVDRNKSSMKLLTTRFKDCVI